MSQIKDNSRTTVLRWTKEKCFEEGRKYNTKKEFRKNCVGGYSAACKKKWIKEMNWFVPAVPQREQNEHSYTIYGYFDGSNKTVYVGLTHNIKARHKRHKQKTKGKYDTVMEYFISNGKELPLPVILKEHLTPKEAQYFEDYYITYYRDNEYTVLNKAKAGSLGGSQPIIWNKEAVMNLAMKYEYWMDFRSASLTAYENARVNGWLKDFDWLKEKQHKWKFKECREIALKYTDKHQFKREHPNAYESCRKHKWIRHFNWFKESQLPTKEDIVTASEQFDSVSKFKANCFSMWYLAKKNNWLVDLKCYKINRHQNGYWTKERVFSEMLKYDTFRDFRYNSKGAYNAVCKHNWHDEVSKYYKTKKK